MLPSILLERIKRTHSLHEFGPSWWFGRLDASGRPMAKAVAIFVLLLSWISFLASSSLPLFFDHASLLCRMTSSRCGIDKHQRLSDACHQRYVSVGRGIWKRCTHGAKKKKKKVLYPPPLLNIHSPFFYIEGWFIRPIQNYTHTPTPPNSQTGVSLGPLLCWQCLMMCLNSFIHSQIDISFFQTDFILLSSSSQSGCPKQTCVFGLRCGYKTMHFWHCHVTLVPLLTLTPCFHLPLTAGRYHFQSC